MAKKQVTAFELDPAVVGGTDAHPFTFGGFPGLWQVGRPMLPDALGLTVTRMRELVKEFNLPLLEVKVDEDKAHSEFEVPASHIASGASVDPIQDQPRMIEVNGGMIPGPVPSAHMPATLAEAELIAGKAEGAAETAAGAHEAAPAVLADETGAKE